MAEINVLSDTVINKISAGEVVERPASVVKELIENSLDAGADKISIEIEEAGKRFILVEDNGKGIAKEDLPLALLRYATSKIDNENDLNSISTLGFRGEALAAISAVSKVRIESRKKNSPNGFAIESEGGVIGEIFPVGLKEGTRISVKELFYNTPARAKFLKSDPVEISHIISLVESYCLTQSSVSFFLKLNNSNVIELSKANSVTERFFDLFPEFNKNDFREIKNTILNFKIDGLAGDSSKNFSSLKYIFTSVNGRFVKDKLINSAILKAYEDTLERGRYPIIFISISLPFEEVDVNVHPTKKEIKFRQPHIVYDFIYKTIFNTFHPSNELSFYYEEKGKKFEKQSFFDSKNVFQSVKESSTLFDVSSEVVKNPNLTLYPHQSPYKVLCIWRKGFIIVDSPKGLSIVDQHTLHERIRFEQFRHFIEERNGLKKQFLEIRSYSVPRNLRSRMDEICQILNEQGFESEVVSETAIRVRSYPSFLEESEIDPIIEEFISEGGEILKTPKELYKSVLVMRSCRGAVMLGEDLSIEKAQYLIDKLFSLNVPLTCPHGRPIFYTISEEEILMRFRRR